jgi:protease I
MKKALMVVAQHDFQQVEYNETREELEKAGIQITVGSLMAGEATAKDRSKIKVDISIEDANVDDYDAFVFIGGPGAEKQIVNNESAINLVKKADNKKKILAAICIAPLVLANAGVLVGKNATCWNGDGKQGKKMFFAGANFSDVELAVDKGRFITSNGPAAAKKFGQCIAKTLLKIK